MNLCWDEENRLSATRDQYYATANIYDASGNRAWKLGGEVNWMWNNGQGWQAYGDFNLRSWYQSDRALRLRSATDLTENAPVVERGRNQRGVQFNPFKSTQHCSRTNLIQYTPVVERSRNQRGVLEFSAVSQNLKGRPVAPLSGDVTELGTTMTERLRRDFECLGIDYNAFYPGDVRLEALETLLNAPEQADEYQVFFYHSDHLGSSSFITDANGDATQHLQYLPFGEDLVHEQNTAAYLSPYTFSGKERDVETNLSYFGARYYESSLSVWLSVDPMSDKYPSLSAYNYCALNPVMLVDPDGREVESIDDPLKCHKWGKNLFQKIGDKIRDAFWFDTKNTTTYDPQSSEVFDQTKTDEPLNKPLRVEGNSHVTFESYAIEDQLIIKNKKGQEVVNSGSVGTNGTPLNFNLRKGRYNVTVIPNSNPEQNTEGTSTQYKVTITSDLYVKNVRSVYRLWGKIPFWVSNTQSSRNPERHPLPENLKPTPTLGPKRYIFR